MNKSLIPVDPATITVFFDMDGVLMDFYGYIFKELGRDWKYVLNKTDYWDEVAEPQKLFAKLQPLADARILVDGVMEMKKEYGFGTGIITALPFNCTYATAEDHKIESIDMFFPELRDGFRTGPMAEDKHKHCGEFDVIIDDNPWNIAQWHCAGGFGILHHGGRAELTLKALSEYLKIITTGEQSHAG